jgi:hypothetical protein
MCLVRPVKQAIVRERHLVENHSMCTIENIRNVIHITKEGGNTNILEKFHICIEEKIIN